MTKSLFPKLLLMITLVSLLSSCNPSSTPPSITETPSPPPTLSSEPSPTAKPAEFSSSLGLSPEFAAKLRAEGIDKNMSGEKGNWTVNRIISGWNLDGTPIVENNVKLVSIENASVNNPGYPDGIIKGVDNQGKTVFWSETEKAWMRSLQTSGDIENPVSVPMGKQYDIESALLDSDLNKPFPDEALKNYEGWSIDFEYDEATKSSHAYLRPRNNQSIRWVVDKDGKPVWYTTTAKDGTTYEYLLAQLLLDGSGKSMFVRATAGEWWQNIGSDTFRNYFEKIYLNKSEYPNNYFPENLLPSLEIAQNSNWFGKHNWASLPSRPSLDSLLGQPGNDPGKLVFPAYDNEYKFSDVFLEGFDGALKSSQKIYERPIGELNADGSVKWAPLPSDLQKLLFALSFTVK